MAPSGSWSRPKPPRRFSTRTFLPLFDSGTADGFLFYVMPFIDGETLRGKLDRETQLGLEEAVRITTEVATQLGVEEAVRYSLFSGAYLAQPRWPQYDLSAEGSRFVMVKPGKSTAELRVMTHFETQALHRLATRGGAQ